MTEPLDINFSEFDEYIRQGEPDQQEKAGIWSVFSAIYYWVRVGI